MTKQETTTWDLLRAIRGVDDTQGNQFSITVTKEKRIVEFIDGRHYAEDDYRIRSSATVPAKRQIISRDYYIDPDGIIISKYWGGFKTYPISTTTILEAVGHGYIINGTFADKLRRPTMAAKKNTPKRSERAKETWNEIKGIMSVYGTEFDGKKSSYISWSASIGKKDKDGEYENYYLKVRFASDAEEPETDGLHQIDITNAFLSLESYGRGKQHVVVPVLVILENTVID